MSVIETFKLQTNKYFELFKEPLLYVATFFACLWITKASYNLSQLCAVYGFFFIALATTNLRLTPRVEHKTVVFAIIAIMFAGLVCTQAVLALLAIFGTTFIFNSPPLQLHQYKIINTWRYTINCSAIYFTTAYIAHQFIGFFPFLIFLITFAFLGFLRNAFSPKTSFIKLFFYMYLSIMASSFYFFWYYTALKSLS